uniref:Uncharacterized protein n=1 Tax=Strigamia maritima TaxID=126957 RepID=T1JNP0_STRMM
MKEENDVNTFLAVGIKAQMLSWTLNEFWCLNRRSETFIWSTKLVLDQMKLTGPIKRRVGVKLKNVNAEKWENRSILEQSEIFLIILSVNKKSIRHKASSELFNQARPILLSFEFLKFISKHHDDVSSCGRVCKWGQFPNFIITFKEYKLPSKKSIQTFFCIPLWFQ